MKVKEQLRHKYMDGIDEKAESGNVYEQHLVPSTQDEEEMSDDLYAEHVAFNEDGSHSHLMIL